MRVTRGCAVREVRRSMGRVRSQNGKEGLAKCASPPPPVFCTTVRKRLKAKGLRRAGRTVRLYKRPQVSENKRDGLCARSRLCRAEVKGASFRAEGQDGAAMITRKDSTWSIIKSTMLYYLDGCGNAAGTHGFDKKSGIFSSVTRIASGLSF